MIRTLFVLVSILAGLLAAPPVSAIEFDEVRDYGEVFVISGSAPGRDRIEVRWDIEDGYYLYNNKFLRFRSGTDGVVLGEPQVPRGELSFDELLGEEVEKYHGQLTVTVPLVSVPGGVDAVQLNVRSQGCLEDELCYPPSQQVLLVSLPPEAALDSLFSGITSEPLADPAATEALPMQDRPALPPEQAFVYESIGYSPDTALVRFTAQPGYYLYRDKFEFRVAGDSGFSVGEVTLPPGVIKDDPEFGAVPVYYGQVEIPVRFNRPAAPAGPITLEADFQGCRDGDICYPPMSRSARFEMPASDVAMSGNEVRADSGRQVAAKAPVSEQDKLARLLTSHPARAIAAFFVAGLLLAFTPCVFPMVPILSGIIVGQGERLTTRRAFWLSLVYVLAMAVTYTVAGVLAGLFGQNLQAVFQNPWILSGFVLVFVLLALSMFGFYELQLPGRLQTRLTEASNRQQGGQLWGVAVMGFLSALIVGPCVAPPLMAALIVIGSSGDAVLGGSALFALAMGMGTPLIAFGVSAGKLVPRAGAWMDAVKAVFGVGLLALAIWMLERILPGGLIMLLWGALAIGCGVYLGALERIEPGASGWRRLWKSLGVLLLILGTLEIIGAAAGGDDWTRPLQGIRSSATHDAEEAHLAFGRIKSLEDLDRAVAQANASGRGAMLDFYADWCVECIRMERKTFPEPGVQALLAELQPLQADVTANDDVDQALMREFGIIGPPAILFFDRDGREMRDWRLVGYFDPEEFSAHLRQVLAAQ
ncbi:MAG: protein-disulfide reductase DsbD [Gammaproteobacteria bacterium]|nr:protein-disulfide reductase DsbD [Gammaproteobacteria bacterium]